MPATATRKLFCNWFEKRLQVSDRNGAPFILPSFTKYETIPFQVVIVEPDLTAIGIDRYARVDISALSLSITINDSLDDPTPLAQQTVFAKDEILNIFAGELALNTGLLNAWLGSSASKTAFIEIEFQEGTSRNKIYIADVTVANSVTQIGSTAPTPVDEYYTKAQILQQFVPRVMGAGESLTFTTPDGLYQRVLAAGNGQVDIDQWFPAPP